MGAHHLVILSCSMSQGCLDPSKTRPTRRIRPATDPKLADPIIPAVSDGSWPPEPENSRSAGGFSLQNLKKPDQTEILAFPDEVIYIRRDLSHFRRDLNQIHGTFTRFGEILPNLMRFRLIRRKSDKNITEISLLNCRILGDFQIFNFDRTDRRPLKV